MLPAAGRAASRPSFTFGSSGEGPSLQAPATPEIRTIKRSRLVKAELGKDATGAVAHLVANTRLDEFRCLLADLNPAAATAPLSKAQLEALRVKPGDTVRATAL